MPQKRTSKMVRKNGSNKSSQLARAYMLSFQQLMVWAIIFAFVGGLTVWTSMAAGPKGGSGTGSLSLQMVKDLNSDGQPNFSDTITYKVTSTIATVWVTTECNQNGVMVYSQTAGFYADYPWGQNFQLGPTYKWAGGPANCTASLYYTSHNKNKVLNQILFVANG